MVGIDQNKYIVRTEVVSFDPSFPGFEWAGGAETRFSWTFFRFCFLACCWGGVLVAPRPLVTLELLGPGLTRLVVLAGEVETVRRGGFLGALLDTAGTLCKWQHGGCFSYVHNKLLLSLSVTKNHVLYT